MYPSSSNPIVFLNAELKIEEEEEQGQENEEDQGKNQRGEFL